MSRRMPWMFAATGLVILWIGHSLASGQTASSIPRMGGKPNLNGIWESLSTANWDLQDHSAYAGPMLQMGNSAMLGRAWTY